MGKPVLSPTQVRRIKMLLETGEYTQHQISKKYGVSRSQVCKIHLGMKNPMDKNGRWGDIEI
jgi:transcriptional regulator with XRE-family HTH domain